ncbi:hypothetical protein [Breoghania sp. L-A4]|uniref:hypothetical protein n=1 Tax=Breoghania sp. L-A4 TaxID=2304600 RepID=UPI0013C36265|nr:hypothetical protein [Breoghania sp. L-A4]
MTDRLFDFWSKIPRDACCHPEDATVLGRAPHHFQADCLPAAYWGPLITAPIVLLFLSPGFTASDVDHAQSEEGRSLYERQRTGAANLPNEEEYPAAYGWWNAVTRQFGVDWSTLRKSVAFLNLGAYKSKQFHDPHMLSALPSSRVTLAWAQAILFPQAEAGERLVICLRSAKYWGLATKEDGPFGDALYAPPHTRAGVMLRTPLRDRITAEFRRRLNG